MSIEIQSVVAGGVVMVATGVFIYSTFLKKKSGCDAGCGCGHENKKFPSSKDLPPGGDKK